MVLGSPGVYEAHFENNPAYFSRASLCHSPTSLGPSCKGFLAISWTRRACFCLRASTFAIFSAGDAPTCGLSSWSLLHFRFLFKWQFLPRCFSWFSYPQAAPSSSTEPQEVLLASYRAQVPHTTHHYLEFHHARTCLLIACLPPQVNYKLHDSKDFVFFTTTAIMPRKCGTCHKQQTLAWWTN